MSIARFGHTLERAILRSDAHNRRKNIKTCGKLIRAAGKLNRLRASVIQNKDCPAHVGHCARQLRAWTLLQPKGSRHLSQMQLPILMNYDLVLCRNCFVSKLQGSVLHTYPFNILARPCYASSVTASSLVDRRMVALSTTSLSSGVRSYNAKTRRSIFRSSVATSGCKPPGPFLGRQECESSRHSPAPGRACRIR